MEIHTHAPQAMRRVARAQRYKYASTQGALVTKDAVRAIEHPGSELWTTLATTYWLQKALSELPPSHPSQEVLQNRLRSEPSSPAVSCAPTFTFPEPKTRPTSFADLPHEIRSVIHEYSVGDDQDPVTPILRPHDHSRLDKPQGSNIVPPVSADISRLLRDELTADLPSLCSSNTYYFDTRDDQDVVLLRRWMEELPEQACVAKSIRIKHWTWWHVSSGSWKHAADETVITLLPSGLVKMTRTGGRLDPKSCCCPVEDLLRVHCPSWKFNQPWKVIDFALALRQEEEPLIQAVNTFIELIQRHTEDFHEWRDSPAPCPSCGEQMIFLRSSGNM